MGQFVSSHVQQPLGAARNSVTEMLTKKRKRSSGNGSSDEELNEVLDATMRSPKKKKLTTAQYIYQALFIEEKSSDITVYALKVWHLHKVYLCQSPYFASMFGGAWRETDKDFIEIDVVDPRITKESLFTVFGSLYLDEVTLEPRDIISTLATATVFQLDGLIERCAEVMNESMNAETAIEYYEAACQYGVKSVKRAAFDWLLANLLSFYTKHSKWLRQISVDLMHLLVSNPDLFVMQTEFSIYILLRYWMFHNLNPLEEGYQGSATDKEDLSRNPITYFSQREGEVPFIETCQGRPFRKPFQALRLNYLLSHHRDVELLLKDNILPKSWFFAPLLQQWSSMLSIDESLDRGPTADCDENVFYSGCLRCGRTLQEEGFQKWRWTGFNFGLDLVLITDTRMLSIKRHHRTEHEKLLSMQVKRNFLIRVTVASLNQLRQVKHRQCTGIRALSLEKNQEVQLLTMDKDLEYPLLISVNLLITSPNGSIEKKLKDFQQIIDSSGATTSTANNNMSRCLQQLMDSASRASGATTPTTLATTLDST